MAQGGSSGAGSNKEGQARCSAACVHVGCAGRKEHGELVQGATERGTVHEWLSQHLQLPVFLVRARPNGVAGTEGSGAAGGAEGSAADVIAQSPRTLATLSVEQPALAWRSRREQREGGGVAVATQSSALAGHSFNATGPLLLATVASAEHFLSQRAAAAAEATGLLPSAPAQCSTPFTSPALCSGEACALGEQFRVNVLLAPAPESRAAGAACGGMAPRAAQAVGAHAEDEWDRLELQPARGPCQEAYGGRGSCAASEACVAGAALESSARRSLMLRALGAAERCAAVNVAWRRGGEEARNLRVLARYRKRGGAITWGVFMAPEPAEP